MATTSTPGVPAISQDTLQQAGAAAQNILGQMMKGTSGQQTQSGGNHGVADSAMPLSGAMFGGGADDAVTPAAVDGTKVVDPVEAAKIGAMVGGAVTMAVGGGETPAVAAADVVAAVETPVVEKTATDTPAAGTSLFSGGRRRRQNQNQNQKQQGGMLPGLMAAVETALVPLGLYVGQKALQSRSGRVYSAYNNVRGRFSRGTRRRGGKKQNKN